MGFYKDNSRDSNPLESQGTLLVDYPKKSRGSKSLF